MIYEEYIHTKKLNLNLDVMKDSCEKLYDLVKEKFSQNKIDYTGQSTLSTGLFGSYNLLLYPLDEFHELYEEIKTMLYEIEDGEKQKYYIQCWLNYYQKGDFINWHGHWKPEHKSYHGFFCVDCEPSKTTYKVPGYEEIIPGKKSRAREKDKIVDVESKNNLLVMSKSDGDIHRTWPWEYEDRPRITIAFDIVPKQFIQYDIWLNHWIPL